MKNHVMVDHVTGFKMAIINKGVVTFSMFLLLVCPCSANRKV